MFLVTTGTKERASEPPSINSGMRYTYTGHKIHKELVALDKVLLDKVHLHGK